ncbi:hypothetical protein DL765_004685 [Monosporascus sp. GIB2]|nr:hypothetical protein DL765_004685 [Monosporascus sp. GIB2]
MVDTAVVATAQTASAPKMLISRRRLAHVGIAGVEDVEHEQATEAVNAGASRAAAPPGGVVVTVAAAPATNTGFSPCAATSPMNGTSWFACTGTAGARARATAPSSAVSASSQKEPTSSGQSQRPRCGKREEGGGSLGSSSARRAGPGRGAAVCDNGSDLDSLRRSRADVA